MFTGIIAHLGRLHKKHGAAFTFSADHVLVARLSPGASIAVNGVCLTVTNTPTQETFIIEIMPETQRKTMLSDLTTRSIVNLELPATAQTLLSGHIVQGHVDGTGTIQTIHNDGNSHIVTITIPQQLKKYVVDKGTICVNGISLTVIEAHTDSFTVGIIPYTYAHTMLHTAHIGDRINIEVDVIAKYVEKLLSKEE